jgi:hypothetical protein
MIWTAGVFFGGSLSLGKELWHSGKSYRLVTRRSQVQVVKTEQKNIAGKAVYKDPKWFDPFPNPAQSENFMHRAALSLSLGTYATPKC